MFSPAAAVLVAAAVAGFTAAAAVEAAEAATAGPSPQQAWIWRLKYSSDCVAAEISA